MSSHLVDSLAPYSISSNCYSLNSPDPTSVAADTSGASSSSASPSASSSLPSPSPSSSSPGRKRTKSFTSSGFLAPPSSSHRFFPTPPTPPRSPARSPARASTSPRSPATPSHVLTTPDPANAVAAARQSVQFQPNGVNWSRPIPAVDVLPSIRIHCQRVSLGSTAPWLDSHINSASSTTSPPLDIVCEMTPVLPPGAAPPATCNDWKVKGLGMVGIDFEQHEGIIERERQHSEVTSSSSSSRSSSEGSLAGDSVHTASTTSTPATPTRLQFVSESFEARWNPANLDELRNLRKAAAELDTESRRLRRMRGREPVVSPRTLPRKAVPIVSAIDLAVQPKPRRPAVRHSLIAPPHNSSSFALLADPIVFPAPLAGGPSRHSPAFQASAATRRPFYAQGKAAMSVIEFSPRKDPQASTPSSVFPSSSRTRQVSGTIPTLASLRAERAERTAAAERAAASMSISPPVATVAASSSTNLASTGAAPPTAAPVCGEPLVSSPESSPVNSPVRPTAARLPPGTPVAFPGGPPPSPPAAQRGPTAADKPERTLSLRASSGFLNKHKKLSRLLGKTPVVSA